MALNIPRLVTIEIGPAPATRNHVASCEPLCTTELLVLIDELADLGVPAVRFSLHASEANDGALRAIEHARQRKLAPVVALRGDADRMLIAALAATGASGIAVPLHSHAATVHQTIAGPDGDWGRSIALTHMVRERGAALEIETSITNRNSMPLMPLMEAVEALRAAQWRIAFAGSSINPVFATTAATVILHAAASNPIGIIVHDLPQLSAVMTNRCGRFAPPELRNLTIVNAGEAMRVSGCGDVCFDDLAAGGRRMGCCAPRANRCSGSIRSQPIDQIYRMSTMSEMTQSSTLQANAIATAAGIAREETANVDSPAAGPAILRKGFRRTDSFYHCALV